MNAIEFENISKQYKLGYVSTKTLSHDLNRWWTVHVRHKEDPYLKIGSVNDRSQKADSDYVWALKDINFNVEQGDVVGIIGKNGAGKSTLLKLLSRVTAPTTGEIRARGRIASLLEVGTGFHPELTGRENVYMNGSIMGMTKKEISSKLDEIVDFAGVERYIDTPVKRYSSGMMVRLGFAVAAHLEPEILVVDEVLAVGDAEFQKKAIGKMQDVSSGEGRTVLFVSHNMTAVKNLCKSGILLENGYCKFSGKIQDVVNEYLSKKDNCVRQSEWNRTSAPCMNGIKFLSAKLLNENDDLYAGDELDFEFVFESEDTHLSCFDITFLIRDEMDNLLFEASTHFSKRIVDKTSKGVYKAQCKIPADFMNEGIYRIGRIFFVKDGVTLLFYYDNVLTFELKRKESEDGFGYQGEKMGLVRPKVYWNMECDDVCVVNDF